MAEKKVRIVHYINQFFAGIGGEEKGSSPLEHCEGPKGPGVGLMHPKDGKAGAEAKQWASPQAGGSR